MREILALRGLSLRIKIRNKFEELRHLLLCNEIEGDEQHSDRLNSSELLSRNFSSVFLFESL